MDTQKSVADEAGGDASMQPVARAPYVRPELKRLGSVAELTLGTGGSVTDFPGAGNQHKSG